jgi:glycosyltransferase involved in cell wall biosynthesis
MSLDIVIPAHNEEDRIARTLRAYRRGFPQRDVRFLVALDGCVDHTSDIVRDQAVEDDRVVLHEFPKLGKGGVLMETFRRCDADLVAFVDADCATPPAELARMTRLASDADGVIGSRRMTASFTPSARRRGRSLTSSGFAWGVRRLFHLPYADTQCGAKVIHRRVAERVVPLMSSRDFLFDVDLLLIADRLGFDVVEVPTVWIDQEGSKLSTGRDASRMLKSALRLWIHHRTMPVEPEPGATAREPAAAFAADRTGSRTVVADAA